MAAATSSPNGFSYAQAAKNGRSPAATSSQTTPASQPTPSKVTSGTATPATSSFSELTPGGSWADDVEESAGDKAREVSKEAQEQDRSAPVKDGAVERAKSEEKAQSSTSGVSSPDLAASSSTTTKDDDSSSAPNGSSSETTWETKSSTSEPAWIAERKERQSSSQSSDHTVKGEKKSKEPKEPPLPSPVKPVALQEAPPPPVNPWMKRAEEAKAKLVVQQPAPKPVVASPRVAAPVQKENQQPRPDSRRKANSIAGLSREDDSTANGNSDSRKPGSFQNKRASDVRSNNFRQGSKRDADEGVPSSASKLPNAGRSSLPNSAAPPPVKDEVSWPTPETVSEKERKDVSESDAQEKPGEDATPTQKSRKKPEWQTMVVTPNIIFETPIDKQRGAPRQSNERSARGPSTRGRGGHRGGANGTNGGERNGTRGSMSQSNEEEVPAAARGRSNTFDRSAMPPPPKLDRASSASSWREQNKEAKPERSSRGQSLTEPPPQAKELKNVPLVEKLVKSLNGFTASITEDRRTQSPHKLDNATAYPKEDEERIPEPIPRRQSVGTQTEEKVEQPESTPRSEPPVRMVPSENRKERNAEGFRDNTWPGPSRGGKRGGRGRGGSRDFVNGHPGPHVYTNGFPPEFASANPYGLPPSPSAYQGPRGNGNHQFAYPQQPRGGWSRGNPRAQSIPDGYYGRFPNPYGGPQGQLPPVQTYVPGMYNEFQYPMTAYPPYVEQQMVMDMVSMQLEYYFSVDNLLKDIFLRKHMDSQGFVFLDFVASFKRIQGLTQDRELLKAVCINSDFIEIRVGEDGVERLRKREGWEQFVLPADQREPTAQNDGPQTLQRPERPQVQVYGQMPFRGPASAGAPAMHQRPDRRSYDSGNAIMNGAAPQFMGFRPVAEAGHGEMVNGDDVRGRAAKSPIQESSVSPSKETLPTPAEEKDSEPDAFPDDEVSKLTVVVKVHQQRPSHAASRTFSNGSIDSRSIFSELERSGNSQTQSPLPQPSIPNGEVSTNGTTSTPSRSLSRHTSPDKTSSSGSTDRDPERLVFWMKDKEDVSATLPEGVLGEPYTVLRMRALTQRRQAATGTCPYDLDVLYQFWCHFLIRNFNKRMYDEFVHYAHDDAAARSSANGLQSLVRFYDQWLLSSASQTPPVRERVLRDYVELVKAEDGVAGGEGFKALRAAWRNGALNLKMRKRLAELVDEGLKGRLEG